MEDRASSLKKTLLIFIFLVVLVAIGGIIFKLFFTRWSYRNWRVYQDPHSQYQVMFPPGWREAIGNTDQDAIRQFVLDKNQADRDDPAFTITVFPAQEGYFDEYRQLKSASLKEKVIFRGNEVEKIDNVNLDGCRAPLFYSHIVEYDYSPKYVTICAGNKRVITIEIAAGTKEILEEHKNDYDRALASFKFNGLQLSDQNFKPTPTEPIEWKSYVNDDLGFELDYLSNWKIHADLSFEQYNFYLQSGIIYISPFSKAEIFDGKATFVIIIFKRLSSGRSHQTIINYFKQQEQEFYPIISVHEVADLNGLLAIKEIGTFGPNEHQRAGELTLYYVDNEKSQRKFAVGYGYLPSQKSEYQKIFDHMLSTFRFM